MVRNSDSVGGGCRQDMASLCLGVSVLLCVLVCVCVSPHSAVWLTTDAHEWLSI